MTLPAQAQKFIEIKDVMASSIYESASRSLRSDYNKLVYKTVLSLREEPTNTETIGQSIRMTRAGARLDDDTVEALVFLVMMETANDAREDLKIIISETKKHDELKRKLRIQIQQQQTINSTNMGAAYKPLAVLQDIECGEIPLLKMQLAMERITQLNTAISNIMKTKADTIRNTIANIK